MKHVGIEWKCSSALPDTGVMDISFSWKLLICMRNSARKLDLLDMPQSFTWRVSFHSSVLNYHNAKAISEIS